MIGSLLFLIYEAGLNLRRHGLMTLACVSTSAVALLVFALFALLAWQTHAIARAIPRRFEVHAFLRVDLPRGEAEGAAAAVRAMPEVARVRLVPRETAWAEYKEHYPHREDLEGLTENPLPDKLEIAAVSPEATLAVADRVRALPGVAHVNEGREVLRKLLAIAGMVRAAGLALAAALALGTALLVSNTIKIALFARRRDIRVMQLVGATNSFIRLPFLLEGLAEGTLGGALAGGVLLAALRAFTTRVLPGVPFVREFRLEMEPLLLAGALVAGGALLGALGSLLSLRRFLRAV